MKNKNTKDHGIVTTKKKHDIIMGSAAAWLGMLVMLVAELESKGVEHDTGAGIIIPASSPDLFSDSHG